jgi:hypothetical protein
MNKTNTQKRWLNLGTKRDQSMIKMSLMDNGDWEYDRLGIGKTGKDWFLVDLDDTGESKRVMNMCKEGMNGAKILIAGVKHNVFEKIDWGYDEQDTHRVRCDDQEHDWEGFYKEVLVNEDFDYGIED